VLSKAEEGLRAGLRGAPRKGKQSNEQNPKRASQKMNLFCMERRGIKRCRSDFVLANFCTLADFKPCFSESWAR
jgi:hypothetical protein